MSNRLSEEAQRARIASCKLASETSSTGTSASDDDNWFKTIANSLLGKPGLELHLITGTDESLCYKYAKGTVKPPGYFIRTLLRSEQGAQFLAALMDGSDASWWREHQRALKIGRAAIAADS